MAQFRDRTIDDFKGKLVGGGARPNLFEVNIQLPTGLGVSSDGNIQEKMRFMVKAAQLPSSTIGDIPVPFRGRILHVAGDRTFEPWTVTVMNDTDFSIRSAMEKWSNAINKHDDDSGVIDPNVYQTVAEVDQLGRARNPGVSGGASIPILRRYVFKGIFPTQVTAIDLDYGSTDQIEEFQVQFQINWWEAYTGSLTPDLTN